MPLLLATNMHHTTRAMVHLAALTVLRVHEIDLIVRTINVTGKAGVKASIPMHEALLKLASSMPPRGWWFPSRGGSNPTVDRNR